MKLFKKILVANRGEIAVRIFKSAKKLGIKTVAIYDETDQLHIHKADEFYSLGTGELKDTYLNIDKIIDIALKNNCEAIHPGYGFLAENPLFVQACENANITFIGPGAESMRIMGNKIEARDFINKIKIPTTKGATGDIATLKEKSKDIPFPILIKAAAGGGGKGMRIVHSPEEFDDAIEATSREATNYFGNGDVFLEQFIENPRHIEIQVISDHHGNHIHLFERECSIQRRYQKIIEESPSPTLNQEVREKMGEQAVKIAREIGYRNAGTIEFLVDKDLNFYFLEMNTRVQVEHPVTEMVTGVDIVENQILIAAGNKLQYKQSDIQQKGHAIESRIYAEDPEQNFIPAPGKMIGYHVPSRDNIRIDTVIEKPITIESSFDPMISKLVVWKETREKAIELSRYALKNYAIHGIKTNVEFLLNIFENQDYLKNNISTKWCENQLDELIKSQVNTKNGISKELLAIGLLTKDLKSNSQASGSIWNAVGYWRDNMNLEVAVEDETIPVFIKSLGSDSIEFEINDKSFKVNSCSISDSLLQLEVHYEEHSFYFSEDEQGKQHISFEGFNFIAYRKDQLLKNIDYKKSSISNGEDSNHVVSPMPGKVIKINVSVGDTIAKGDNLLIVEAMKMENNILAPKDGKISELNIEINESVDSQKILLTID